MKVPNKILQAMNLATSLEIAIGSRVELTTNVDVGDGLSNELSWIVIEPNRKSVIVWVRFENERIGRNLRNKSKHLYSSKTPATWTPIEKIYR